MCEFRTHTHSVYNMMGNTELAKCSYQICFQYFGN